MGETIASDPQATKPRLQHDGAGVSEILDLRGVRCPLNWAKAKVELETLPRGAELELILDDPKGARDIPQAAEAEGYAVIEVQSRPGHWRLIIRV